MRIFFTCLLGVLTANAFSQNINQSIDSINTLLCRKWQVDYALMRNTAIGQLPGAAEINFEFLRNGTVIMTSSPATDTAETKGTWNYDSKNKRIKIVTYHKNTGEVTGLNEEMLIVQMNEHKNESSAQDMKLVCKPKTTASIPQKQIQIKSPGVQIKNTSLKNPDSAILYIGVQNMIEIERAQANVSISVAPTATIKRISANKFAITPLRKGTFLVTVSQNDKMIMSKTFTAINKP